MDFTERDDQELPVILPLAADEVTFQFTFHFTPLTLEVAPSPLVFKDGTFQIGLDPPANPLGLLISNDWDELVGRAAELEAQGHPRNQRGALLLARLQVIILRRSAFFSQQERYRHGLSSNYTDRTDRELLEAETLEATLQRLAELRRGGPFSC